jgi:outer membrane receptor protein involved in Fe transport
MTPAPVAQAARDRRARAGGNPFSLLALILLGSVAAHAEAPNPAAAPAASQPSVVREAPEISVTASRGERNVLDVPAHVTVLDRKAIARSGAANVPELLRREAGLFTTNTTTNPEGYSVETRGFQNGGGNGCRTLVLVDGRRVNEADTGCPDWTFIGLEDIERVEIVRGPGSAMYGDNAIGGVIHIFTRRGAGTRASLGGSLGEYDSEDAEAAAAVSFGALRLRAAASYQDTAGFRERADYEAKRVRGGVDLDLGELGVIGLTGGYGTTERSRPSALFAPYGTRDGERGGRDLSAGNERERFVQGDIDVALPAGLSLKATPFYRRSRSASDSVFDFAGPFPFAFHAEDEQDSRGVDVQLARDFDLGFPLRVTGGGEVRKDDYETATDFGANAAQRRILGAFVQAEVTLADVWLVSAGLRYDDSDLEGVLTVPLAECGGLRCDFDDEEWSPRFGVTWRFADAGALFFAFGEGFRFPNLNEAFGVYGFAPALRPETSRSYELGAKWSGDAWRVDASLYHARVENEIFFNPLAPNPLGPFPGINDNVDHVRHRGLEVGASHQLSEWLELYANFTLDDVTVRDDSVGAFVGERMPITPRHRGGIGARLTLPHGFEASVDALFVGERRIANDVAGASARLPRYVRFDARVGWQREIAPGLALVIDAVGRNLSNEHYAEWGGLSTFSNEVGYFPAPERSFAGGVKLVLER